MPRVSWNKPQAQKALEDELRERYGGMMTATDVMHEMGWNHSKPTMCWLQDVPYVLVTPKRKKWRVAEVAKKIHMHTVSA